MKIKTFKFVSARRLMVRLGFNAVMKQSAMDQSGEHWSQKVWLKLFERKKTKISAIPFLGEELDDELVSTCYPFISLSDFSNSLTANQILAKSLERKNSVWIQKSALLGCIASRNAYSNGRSFHVSAFGHRETSRGTLCL